MSNAIVELGLELYQGIVKDFSVKESNETLRKALLELVGCEDGKFNFKKFRKNQHAVYEVLEEILDVTIEEGIRDQFEQFVEYKQVDHGQQVNFRVKNSDQFEVSTIAGGTNNLQRQRIGVDTPFIIQTAWEGVKVYEELELFLAGRIDWNDLIDRVSNAFILRLKEKIYTAIKSAYSAISAPYSHTGSFDLEKFNDIVAHVEARTGKTPIVLGTRKALRKVTPSYMGEASKEDRNKKGFFEVVDGITFGVIPQSHKVGTDTFAIDDNFLLIIPQGDDEKIIKVVTEGEALIKETTGQANADNSQEYTVLKKLGVGVVSTTQFGVYILQ